MQHLPYTSATDELKFFPSQRLPSIACNSPRYVFGVIWACAMIVVYPIGVLGLYFYFLYHNREAIKEMKVTEAEEKRKQKVGGEHEGRGENHDDDDIHQAVNLGGSSHCSDDHTAHAGATAGAASPQQETHDDKKGLSKGPIVGPAELTFLYRAYEGRVWYWEVVETIRRLLLTAVVSVVGIGSSAQVVFGIVISIVYVKLYGHFQPYELDELDIVQEVAQYQVFFTFFFALLIRDNILEGSVWARVLDILLVITNLSTVTAAIVVYLHLHEKRLPGLGWGAKGPAVEEAHRDVEEGAGADNHPPLLLRPMPAAHSPRAAALLGGHAKVHVGSDNNPHSKAKREKRRARTAPEGAFAPVPEHAGPIDDSNFVTLECADPRSLNSDLRSMNSDSRSQTKKKRRHLPNGWRLALAKAHSTPSPLHYAPDHRYNKPVPSSSTPAMRKRKGRDGGLAHEEPPLHNAALVLPAPFGVALSQETKEDGTVYP